MLFINLCVLFTLLVTTKAFYPFFPEYLCLENGSCGDTHQIKARANNLDVGPTLNLIQHVTSSDITGDAQVERLVGRLARKYNRTSQVGSDSGKSALPRGLDTRRIIPAAQPTQPMSAGIQQDGNDFSYFAEVSFGSASSKMLMLLDTGADVSWIMGNGCTNSICRSRNTFGPANSTTFQSTGQPFSVTYGSGSVKGSVATDTVSFAGLNLTMPFGVADNVSKEFANFEIYGILGLSAAKSSTSVTSFVDAVVASKALQTNMFGMSLSRSTDGVNTGAINFGVPDVSKFNGNLNYYPLAEDNNGDWKIVLASAGFGTSSIPLAKNAIFDTGTSFMFIPPDDAARIHAAIPGSATSDGQNFEVPCDTKTPLILTFGSNTFSIPSESWLGPAVNGVCTSNLYGLDVTPGEWLIGDTFLKQVYVVFDVDNKQIGLAQAKLAGSSPVSTTLPGPATITSASTAAATSATPLATPNSAARNLHPHTVMKLLLGAVFGSCIIL